MSDAARAGAGGPGGRRRLSSGDLAFEGFAIAGREPRSILAWALVMAGFVLVSAVTMVLIAGPAMMQMSALQRAGGRPDPALALGSLARTFPATLLLLAISLFVYGAIYAAVNRAVLRPTEGGFGHLGVGRAELRQAGVLALVWLILGGVYLACIILGFIVVLGARLVSPPLAVVAGLLVGLGALALLLFLAVRLSLASPLALDRGRIDLGAAWRLTRGAFWPLLGAYVLAAIFCVLIMIGVFVVVAVMAGVFGGGAGALFRPDMSSLGAYFGVAQLINILVSSAAYGLIFPVMLGPPARAYAQLTGEAPAGAAPASAARDLSTGFAATA